MIKFLFCFTVFILTYQNLTAQCAGSDGSLEICDITDPANQNLDLFNLLNNNPDTGGTWETDADNSVFVDQNQGIVNIWNLTQGGVYQFDYTIDNNNCGTDTSTVTLTVGGYPGTDNFTANACEDDDSVNLFQFISNNPNPHFNGTWTDVDNTGGLNGNTLDATEPNPGTYTFTYTVNAVGNCPAKTATVELTIHPLKDPGDSSEISICGEDELQNFTNVDLNSFVSSGINGNWNEDSGTSQLDGVSDSVINLQEVFNNFGYGVYSFSITATPSHPICEPLFTFVQFEIQRELDYSDADLNVESFCINELDPSGIFTEIINLPLLNNLPDNSLEIGYEISGPVFFQGQTQVNIADFTSFNIDPNFQPIPGIYNISITSINISNDPNELICNIIFDLEDTFEVFEIETDDLNITVNDACLDENISVTVSSPDPNFDGNFTIEYDINGANQLLNQSDDLNFVNGEADFTINADLLPNTGNNILTVNSISDGTCTESTDISDDFEIFENPPSNVNLSVDNICLGDDLNVSISNLSNLDNIEIEYTISGANNFSDLVSLQVFNDSAEFIISANNFLTDGIYTIEITSLINLDTGCSVTLDSNIDFEIYDIPSPPDANLVQEFCEVDQPQIGDLQPNDNNIFWYNSQNSTAALNDDVVLEEGEYWLSQTNSENCESQKTPISVIINEVPDLILNAEGNLFCGSDEPQIQDLSANTDQFPDFDIIWLDDVNGNPVSDDTFLIDNESYFGIVSDPVTGCESANVVEVNVDLTACEPNSDFLIPDGFSPNEDGINDVFRIIDIQFIYPDYEFEIYNRYGKLLFTGNKDEPAWNGKSTESDVLLDGIAPNGVYFYVLHFNSDNRSSEQGRLYLNR